jgi:DNA polymerase-3 subunit alpha
LRLADAQVWTRPEQMAAEKEAFGFYFAAHPVQEFRHVASANGARSHASLMEAGGSGGRQPAVMAALVEAVSKGRTRKGGTFVRADFSDSTGQFSAACFEEGLVDSFQRWAADGTCVLLNVELDSPSPDEPPRITVRGARPLAEVSSSVRMRLECTVETSAALDALAAALEPGRPGHGEVLVRLRIDGSRDPLVRLGRDFALGGELVDRLAHVPGLSDVALTPVRGVAQLRLVA